MATHNGDLGEARIAPARERKTTMRVVSGTRYAVCTARLELAPIGMPDAGSLLHVFRDPDVRRYLLDGKSVSADWVTAEIRASEQRFASGGGGLWALRQRSEPSAIGFAGFREFFEPPESQLLYGLLPAFWGQGFATEAATAACRFAFDTLGWKEIRAAIDVPNTASGAVLARLGFRHARTTGDGTAFHVLERKEVRRGQDGVLEHQPQRRRVHRAQRDARRGRRPVAGSGQGGGPAHGGHHR